MPINRKLTRNGKDNRGHKQSGTSATVRDSTRRKPTFQF
jgi:hypothetical protein